MSTTSPTMDPVSSRPTSAVTSPKHIRSRTHSISSDRPSTAGGQGLVLPPLIVSPEAAFIAPSAASQIITNDHDSHADAWYDQNGIEPAAETALVSEAALHLVNSFLDQLLFNFLQVARSTTLSSLRPAVIEVLKPKLAKDAITNADEELREYLGGADESDFAEPEGRHSSRDWDLELVWKRTRLRCMVYSSLGDMEEEDEDLFMEQENLEIGANEQISDVISPAVAIFLTSVMEYMGELTLTVAGQAAYHRVRSKIERELREGGRDPAATADRIVVEELDMERVALDRTLGRLWRGWKKRMRTPTTDMAGRPLTRGSAGLPRHDYRDMDALGSSRSAMSDASDYRKSQEQTEAPIAEDVSPLDIPLPMRDNDIDEIEVPGIAHHSDDEEEEDEDDTDLITQRPKSLLIPSSIFPNGLPTPTKSQPHAPGVTARKRSMSLPTPSIPQFYALSRGDVVASPTQSGLDEDGVQEGARATVPESDKEVTDAEAITDPESKKKPSRAASDVASPEDDVATQASESEYGDAEDVATYEQAEIVTSSRVSVSGSSSANDSDTGKTTPVRRSPSVQSARIIDVAGPKSPGHSRPNSLDSGEVPRPPSASLAGGLARASIVDEKHKRGASEAQARPPTSAPMQVKTAQSSSPEVPPKQKTSPDRTHNKRPAQERRQASVQSVHSTDPISEESEEEDMVNKSYPPRASRENAKGSPSLASTAAVGAGVAAGAAGIVGIAAAAAEPSSHRHHKSPPPPVSLNGSPKSHAHKYDQSPIGTKAATMPASASNAHVEQSIQAPEVPRRATGHTGHPSPKPETRGLLSIERTQTRESDEASLQTPVTSAPRQAHTSPSSISSATSRRKPLRTSEDGSSRSESVARNFEELIQSNQTITYTLTPENMRDIDSKRDSPVVTKFGRKAEDSRAQSSPKSSPIVTQFGKLPSPRLPPTPASPRFPAEDNGPAFKASGPIPRAPTGIAVSPNRTNGPLPRDARVPAESTSDFAEFIKSTGPAGGSKSYAAPKVNTPASPRQNAAETRRASLVNSRSRYQPREAAVEGKAADNSDLIDFIRQGPPIAASSHRIPRHVAPFRTTMDSDQMSGAIGGRAVDANIPDIRNSQASTNMTDSSMPSVQSSVNSKSALLKKNGTVGGNRVFDDDDMMPKRKTRRVRDPYAIDYSDEDEDDQIFGQTASTGPRPPPKKEESLAEFLRNYDPPPVPVSEPARVPRKKSSAPSLIGRFTRGNKDAKDKDAGLSGNSPVPAVESRSLNSRAGGGKGYIPIQVNMPAGYDMYGPIDSNRQANRPRVASAASSNGPRVPMKKFEPRDPVTNRSQTADLAAFLRDSAPPPTNTPPMMTHAASRQDDSGTGSRRFGRKKRS